MDARADWLALVASTLSDLRKQDLYRERRIRHPLDATHIQAPDGRRLVNFSSNNYLGLTHHPTVVAAARIALAEHGLGSGAAPLVTGYTAAHASLERRLATWKGTEASVLLSSGYQANLAAVQTLGRIGAQRTQGVRFILDKLCHASLIDAVRGDGAAMRVFPHNDLAKLNRLLRDADPGQLQVVVTESIFSMDGDRGDLAGLAQLRSRYGFILLVDEAHGSGVYGEHGSGVASELGLSADVDVTIVTLSKAIGCVGGAICGSRLFCDAVVNLGRAFIFSTALPVSIAAAAEAAIGVMRDEPGRQQRVRDLAARARSALHSAGMTIPSGDSPIIPIVLGSERAALEIAATLEGAGLMVAPIRPPTVPRGTSRLRVTLSCEHTDADLARLIDALRAGPKGT